jgi:hypothetical protein
MFASKAASGEARLRVAPGRATTAARGNGRRVPQPDSGVASRVPRTEGATRVARLTAAVLIVDPISSVHGISEHSRTLTKQVALPATTLAVGAWTVGAWSGAAAARRAVSVGAPEAAS